jgi:fucose permease
VQPVDPRPADLPLDAPATNLPSARGGLSAMLLSGFLMSLLGAILPAWRYHIEPNFLLIGSYFLCQNAGIIIGASLWHRLAGTRGTASGLMIGSFIAAAGLIGLGIFSPPAHYAGRLGAFFVVGFGAGVINTGAFHAIVPAYEHEPASTLSLSGVLFNLGALLAVLIVAFAFFAYPTQGILVILAAAPVIAALLYGRGRSAGQPDAKVFAPGWRETLRDFRSPAAVLFALLLFFQFGNEGALSGWLALYLIQRLGVSPVTSLWLLALFWVALLVGRVGGLWLMRLVSQGRLLAGAVFVPMFGCLVLSSTDNMFGAITAVLLVAGGFALILPLVMERIAGRFPYFHPGIFSGIFSIAMTGGFLAPATVGYLAHFWGIGVVAGLPLLGSIAVFLLYWLLVLESKLSRRPDAAL